MKENHRLRKFSIYKVSEWQNQDSTQSLVLQCGYYFSSLTIYFLLQWEEHLLQGPEGKP